MNALIARQNKNHTVAQELALFPHINENKWLKNDADTEATTESLTLMRCLPLKKWFQIGDIGQPQAAVDLPNGLRSIDRSGGFSQ
jgi:hypothetical protein